MAVQTKVASEHDEQATLIEWWRLAYPRKDKLLFAIPNGGLRNIVVAKKLAAEGVVPGVADLFLAIPAFGWHGLFIEMKRAKGGKQSPEQKEFEEAVKQQGYGYILAHGWQMASKGIQCYLKGKQFDYISPIQDIDEEYLTIREVQIILNISRPTAYNLIKTKQLEGVRIGRDWRVKRSTLEQFARRVH